MLSTKFKWQENIDRAEKQYFKRGEFPKKTIYYTDRIIESLKKNTNNLEQNWKK